MTYKNNSRGFSLIEVIVAATIFSVISLAASNLFVQQINANKQLEDKIEKIQMIRSLEGSLSDAAACQNTLVGAVMPAVDGELAINSIKDSLDNDLYLDGQVIGGLTVEGITLRNRTVVAPSSTGGVELEIHLTGSNGLYLKPYITQLRVQVDASSEVTACVLPSSFGDFELGPHEVLTPVETTRQAQTTCFVSLYVSGPGCSGRQRYLFFGPDQASVTAMTSPRLRTDGLASVETIVPRGHYYRVNTSYAGCGSLRRRCVVE